MFPKRFTGTAVEILPFEIMNSNILLIGQADCWISTLNLRPITSDRREWFADTFCFLSSNYFQLTSTSVMHNIPKSLSQCIRQNFVRLLYKRLNTDFSMLPLHSYLIVMTVLILL